jgi:ubiquinol-cytochrome c reductase cytochrome b subunit
LPLALRHPDNAVAANIIVTPFHIVPEWYFLPFYAILRSIPHKLGGVVAILLSLAGLIALPIVNGAEAQTARFRQIYQYKFWNFFRGLFVLGWAGQKDICKPFVNIGRTYATFYFSFLFLWITWIRQIEADFLRS